MAKADCDIMMVGCESGSSKILKDIRKGIGPRMIERTFKWGEQYGIQRRAFFMVGLPNEDEESVSATLKLAKKINPDVFGMTILAPYPGSDFYDPVKHKDVDWTEADEYTNDFWETKNFTNQELKDIQAMFAEEFIDSLAWHMELILEQRNGNE